jgi:hypothetical protein
MIKTQISLSLKWVQKLYTSLLKRLDLDTLSYDLRHQANTETSQQRKNEALKRLQVVEAFRDSNIELPIINLNGWLLKLFQLFHQN